MLWDRMWLGLANDAASGATGVWSPPTCSEEPGRELPPRGALALGHPEPSQPVSDGCSYVPLDQHLTAR